jgi:hypothetical protein
MDGAPPTHVAVQMPVPPVRKNRRLWLAAIAVAVLLVGGIAAAFALGSGGTTVPSVIGKGQESAEAQLASEGLGTKVKTAHVAGKDAGVVLEQSAVPGTEAVEGSTITLTVASGEVSLPIDDLLGVSYDQAVGTLKVLGLEPVRMDQVSSSPAGTVIAVKPDDTAANGSAIDLMVAIPAPVEEEDGDSGGDGENREDRQKQFTGPCVGPIWCPPCGTNGASPRWHRAFAGDRSDRPHSPDDRLRRPRHSESPLPPAGGRPLRRRMRQARPACQEFFELR